jgi:hypothetical protein
VGFIHTLSRWTTLEPHHDLTKSWVRVAPAEDTSDGEWP